MKEMIKNSAILFVITLVAGLLLGFVYENTKDIIKKQEADAKVAAYKEVFKDANDFEIKKEVTQMHHFAKIKNGAGDRNRTCTPRN